MTTSVLIDHVQHLMDAHLMDAHRDSCLTSGHGPAAPAAQKAELSVIPLNEKQIRASFLNASRREAAQATLPDLGALAWDDLDYLGWRDRKAPLSAYVVLELDRTPTGILLRASSQSPGLVRSKALCAWCQDLVSVNATLYVARRAGAAGRAGNTLGTLLCEDFSCSRNVRRPPTSTEAGDGVEEYREIFVQERISGLRERALRFAQEIASTR